MRGDEYNWDTYHKTYAAQVVRVMKKRTLNLVQGDFKIIDGVIHMKKELLPLPPNHQLLYEEILALSPIDVHEVGCGWGNSLANIHLLTLGKIAVYGSEISGEQLRHLANRNQWLSNWTILNDITQAPVEPRDIVFTAAVLMHLSDVNLEKAIRNIAASAKQHILMVENPRRDYPSIFFRINPDGWEDAKVERKERGGGQVIIISK